jgi:sterol desaturase/sphingolipid hydroxylase (fatty acid hydroxylase superfamily)
VPSRISLWTCVILLFEFGLGGQAEAKQRILGGISQRHVVRNTSAMTQDKGSSRGRSMTSNIVVGWDLNNPSAPMRWIVAVGLMFVEYLFHRLNHRDSHDAGETAASLIIALGNKVLAPLTASIAAIPLLFLYQCRLFDFPPEAAWSWPLLFLGVDLCYYFHHIAMHRIRWLWASHAVHHSATRMNWSAGVRLGWGSYLTGGMVFYAPMVLLGFHPAAVLAMLALGLSYQFFVHMAQPPHLGPLEWVLNTPRNHHVHHAFNPCCIDKNFGFVLIIYDRMFGTFAEAPAHEELRFGLAAGAATNNPVQIVFHVWKKMFADVLRARSFMAVARVLFGRPT